MFLLALPAGARRRRRPPPPLLSPKRDAGAAVCSPRSRSPVSPSLVAALTAALPSAPRSTPRPGRRSSPSSCRVPRSRARSRSTAPVSPARGSPALGGFVDRRHRPGRDVRAQRPVVRRRIYVFHRWRRTPAERAAGRARARGDARRAALRATRRCSRSWRARPLHPVREQSVALLPALARFEFGRGPAGTACCSASVPARSRSRPRCRGCWRA